MLKVTCHVAPLITALALLSGCAAGTATATLEPPLPDPEPEPVVRFAKPEYVRGIYLTAWSVGSTRKMEAVDALLKETELNALVIDIRDAGQMYWKMNIELADRTGATKVAVVDPEAAMQRIEEMGAYPIARISCFRDQFVPRAHPELAVQKPDGSPWKDRSGHMWLDPYNRKNWEYLAQAVEFALDLGFPEIQLDYVRFPSEGKVSGMVFPARSSHEEGVTPTEVIAEFSRFIREKVHARGAVLSADIFGIVSSGPGDQGIGQALEIVAEPFDLLCPMVYPSHFAKGEYKVADPNRAPYEIVLKSLLDYTKRLPGKPIRPWLQDFSLYGVSYGKAEVQAQIKAARAAGYYEYLLWNPRNQYTKEAVLTGWDREESADD